MKLLKGLSLDVVNALSRKIEPLINKSKEKNKIINKDYLLHTV